MIAKLKEKSIQKFYNKTIVEKNAKNQPQHKVKKIAILLDNESLENIVITSLTNQLSLKKEAITVLIYKPFEKKQEVLPTFFTDKEVGFKAGLKSDKLKSFVKNEYDLLINYIKTPNLYLNIITLLSKATLKVGFADVDDRLYDLVIADNSFNEAVLNQELKKYLTILKKI
ncbi:hypothetical protein J2Q11_11625 [Tenacibaculum finnmarkense genomovar finnmarkense]|uniref:Uncharacterized protein n=1 Tax=Tenacibaculum finnmarkense genomovar finnmarkense TaxID=1458503 RepID=A0AAP1WGV3_9FLAO|nr:hypothetical protein [Tenacibaculum finnmarkense]MBE7653465.1 hypothetical protein [Tenacibaculum finnmarkense genomovar finnmarkense]MBE7692817.1 hypothetical protein [Tenacibaculum finnmarkense genomovar finnmarkense]MBE7695769.1 hypothetical protein [Tenacibaculum finnmarkense genomovar finnmarkense]MCD8413227.1 hypothetical protein [Tenacibaculum finnmarkense genomovar ulcerans]MCD8418429.1 hypothetical protein [Tenacibaculum finnmarkense genomovar finnmarkense]